MRWHSLEGGGGPAMAVTVLNKARTALPDCLMLHFAAAELEESRGEVDAARSIFEELVEVSCPIATVLVPIHFYS